MPADHAWEVVVVGAGAAGLLAAARSAERGRRTLLLEKNRKVGAKILMSGGTRCNLTQATDRRGIVAAYGPPGRFLHSALARLGPEEVVQLMHAEGVPTKVEPTGKIFPASDRALDVQQALLRRVQRSGCTLVTGEPLLHLARHADGFALTTASQTLTAKRVIVTTGGKSYPGSGTTGDGYAWAAALGHTVLTPRPSLVPLTTAAEWIPPLKGLTLNDVRIRLRPALDSKALNRVSVLAEKRGSLLFTHFGLSGPCVLDISREVSGANNPAELILECDFLPGTDAAEVDRWLRESAAATSQKPVAALLAERIPRRLADCLLSMAGGEAGKLASLSKAARGELVRGLKHLPIPLRGTLGFEKAEVTAGGIALDEVDSRTMQSKLVENLYFAGEILDLDGPIGGYNFQAAFSTGWLAGECV